MLSREAVGWSLVAMLPDALHRVGREHGRIEYCSEKLQALLDASGLVLLEARPGPALASGQRADLRALATPFTVAENILTGAPFLAPAPR